MTSPTDPATGGEPAARRRRGHRRAVRPGIETTAGDDTHAWEDDDRAWGDAPQPEDDRLRRDVPPHWG